MFSSLVCLSIPQHASHRHASAHATARAALAHRFTRHKLIASNSTSSLTSTSMLSSPVCSTVNKMCEVPGCFVRPSFKFPVRGAASQRCARHKLPGMVGNSGKLTGRAFSKGPTSAGDDATLPTLPQSSPVTSTPKRARGELLRIQREQMMRILGEGSAEAEAKPTASPQDCSSALPAKKMKHSSPTENSGDVECETTAKSACSTPKKEDILPQQSTESSMPAVEIVAPGAHTPNSGTYSELAKVAADVCVLNSGASLAVQPSVGVSKTASPFKTAPPFLTQRGVPLMMANSCPAAQPAPQHTLHAATSPGNMNIPYRALSALDFHQAFLALSSTFSPAMWCPSLAAANHYATPFIPSLNPWAAAGLTMPLNWNVLNSPSAAPSMTSPTAASAHNAISQFMHAAPPESMGGPQAQAMPSEPNTAPPYRVDIT